MRSAKPTPSLRVYPERRVAVSEEELGGGGGDDVFLVGVDALEQLLDDGVARVDLEGLLLVGVEVLGGVLGLGVGLALHDALHVAGPAVGGGDEGAGGGGEALGDGGLLDVVLEGVLLEPGGEGLELLLQRLVVLLGLLAVVHLDALLGDVLELLPVELGQGLDAVLVHRLRQVQDLEALLLQALHERRRLHLLHGRARDEVDGLLLVLHPLHVLGQRRLLVRVVGGLEAQELGEASAVGAVFHDAEFDVGGVLLPELRRTSRG